MLSAGVRGLSPALPTVGALLARPGDIILAGLVARMTCLSAWVSRWRHIVIGWVRLLLQSLATPAAVAGRSCEFGTVTSTTSKACNSFRRSRHEQQISLAHLRRGVHGRVVGNVYYQLLGLESTLASAACDMTSFNALVLLRSSDARHLHLDATRAAEDWKEADPKLAAPRDRDLWSMDVFQHHPHLGAKRPDPMRGTGKVFSWTDRLRLKLLASEHSCYLN
jgi:hypothetical protein